jgi:hypothetical protein
MDMVVAFTFDLTEILASFGDEEELASPDVSFRVICIEYDDEQKKHMIYSSFL